MLTAFAVVSFLVSTVLAQNPLIPQGISQGCTNFLNSLNSNSDIANCAQSFTSALQAFGPGSSSTPSASTITSALDQLCKNSGSSCPQSTINQLLTTFYSDCMAELTSNLNQDVQRTYDVLYVLQPLSQAVCSKDDSGNYCVTDINNTTSSDGNTLLETPSLIDPQYLVEPVGGSSSSKRSSSQQVLVPNTTTYASTNLVFLFLQPTLASDKLCKTCTREILQPYINFESSVPYASSLSKSQLLSGQGALYDAIQKECGSSFLSGTVAAAGGIKGGIIGGSPRTVGAHFVLGALAALAVGLTVAA